MKNILTLICTFLRHLALSACNSSLLAVTNVYICKYKVKYLTVQTDTSMVKKHRLNKSMLKQKCFIFLVCLKKITLLWNYYWTELQNCLCNSAVLSPLLQRYFYCSDSTTALNLSSWRSICKITVWRLQTFCGMSWHWWKVLYLQFCFCPRL